SRDQSTAGGRRAPILHRRVSLRSFAVRWVSARTLPDLAIARRAGGFFGARVTVQPSGNLEVPRRATSTSLVKIISKYVLKEHVGPFTFALTALTSLMLLQYLARRFG